MATPTSQKADQRPISFRLENAGQLLAKVPLVIRPEDLSHNQPSLLTATQTFAGAWIDDFGPGLSTIQISGHTGWNLGGGWEENFAQLKSGVFTQWHAARAQAVSEGKSPDDVKLIFADSLDSITAVVAPNSFTLRRNKSRPLLMMYQIGLTVIADLSDDIAGQARDDLLINKKGGVKDLLSGSKSLTDTIGKLDTAAAKAKSFIDSSIVSSAQGFMGKSSAVFGKVVSLAGGKGGLADPEARDMIGLAADLAEVGRNAFWTYGSIAGLAESVVHEVAGVASAYQNAFCLMKNAFQAPNLYGDYSDLYGASSCSSTIGGSALSPLRYGNPFETIMPISALAPAVTVTARSAMEALKVTDPVLAPRSMSSIGSLLKDVSEGVYA